jgi:RNA polymerase sigma-70 factor (ECF subfamily)
MADFGESSYRRFLQGDESALEELIRKYSDPLVRFAYSYIGSVAAAEEIAEDSIVALLLKLRPIKDEAHLRAYLYKTVRSMAIDRLRYEKWLVSMTDLENVLSVCDAEADLAVKERNRILYRAMEQLRDDYREVLILTYFDALTTEQLGQVLGKKPKQIYNLHARAKIALKALLEKEGFTHEDIY